MTDIDHDTAERLARRLETKEPYKSDIQIAVSMIGDENAVVVLGQGDYPTAKQIADRVTSDMNDAAKTIRTLLGEITRLRDALELAIGLGCDLGMTEMEVDAIKERATPPEAD